MVFSRVNYGEQNIKNKKHIIMSQNIKYGWNLNKTHLK